MIEFAIPGSAPSTPNLREHWASKAKRVKAQRAAVARKMPAWNGGPLLLVRLTRIGPRILDSDNMAAALKGHRDAVASRLRVDDASLLVEWQYHQAKGEAEVVVQIWKAGNDAPPLPSGTPVERKRGMAMSSVKTGAEKRAPRPAYMPPRTVLNAAREAEETFAPAFRHHPRCNHEGGGLCACPPGWRG